MPSDGTSRPRKNEGIDVKNQESERLTGLLRGFHVAGRLLDGSPKKRVRSRVFGC